MPPIRGTPRSSKAAELLGLDRHGVRVVASDRRRRLDPEALERAFADDVARRLRSMAVVGSANTVNTGANDPPAAIRDVCDHHSVWMHVDGAYGAPAILDPRYAPELEPLGSADSVAADAHKWLYISHDAGIVMVRDAELMRDTFSLIPAYLRESSNPERVTWLPWFSEYGIEQTRWFRALKIWMALPHHGRAGYAESIVRDNRLADHFASRVDEHPDLELVAHHLSIVCLRAHPAGVSDDQLDSLNRAVVRAVQLGGDAFLTSTELEGRFVLRAGLVNPRMAAQDLDRIIDTIVQETQRQRRT